MAVILPSVYKDGTATVANGGLVVTGQSTLWVNSVLPGDFFGVHKGWNIEIASVDSNTQLTLANPYPGDAQTAAPYAIQLQSDNARMQETSRQLLTTLSSGNNYAFSQLVGSTDTIPYFTGPGTMGLLTKEELTNGVAYDVVVNTLADRSAYDGSPSGFAVLVADVGDGRSAVYAKNSNTSGDWSNPVYITGPVGPTGTGVNPRGDYNGTTAYNPDDLVQYQGSTWIAKIATTGNAPPNLPTTENTQWLIFARSGSAGVVPRGDYNAGTAYASNDLVLYQGSSWIALQSTTGNAPPTLPTTSNANWSLVAAKGNDGTGTGSVTSVALTTPTGLAVAGSPITTSGTFVVSYSAGYQGYTSAEASKLAGIATGAQVNTVTSVAGRSGAVVIASGDVSGLGNSATRNVGTTAGTVAAGDDSRFSSGGSSQNEAIFALEIADLKGSRLGLKGGVADAFDDESGVDVKTNAVYDATNDWYTPTESTPAMTEINPGVSGNTGSFTIFARGTALPSGQNVYRVGAYSVATATLVFKVFNSTTTAAGTVTDLETFSHPGGGWADFTLATPYAVPSTGTYYLGFYSSTAVDRNPSGVRSVATGNASGAVTGLTVSDGPLYAIRFSTALPSFQNMTLQSISYPLSFVPTTGRILMQTVETVAVVANTDFVAEFSRDNGATWTAGNLVLAPYLAVSNYKMYEAQPFSVAAQPSGSSMKWRARTLTNKHISISGIVSQGG